MKYFARLKKKINNSLLNIILPNNFFYFSNKGFCPCCDGNVIFKATDPWLRDHYICSNCGSIPRERALVVIIEKYCPNWRNLNIHESSPVDRGASVKLKINCKNYVSSHYFPKQTFGIKVGNYINEDLEKQTFPDGSFDIVITQDVTEHILNPDKAFSEIGRTLKKGGVHIFTVPLVNKHNPSEKWAVKDINGELRFLNTPEYHGNPINPNGSPVSMHWGYDIIKFIKDKSDLDTKIEFVDNLFYGIRAEFNEVLVSMKN